MRSNGSPSTLTDKQRAIYALVVNHYRATGEACSLTYLARRLRRHHSTVRGHLVAIAKKGWATAASDAFQGLLI